MTKYNNNRLMETLTSGRDSARRLQNLVRRKANLDGSVSVDDLLTEIVGSFSVSISMLNGSGEGQGEGYGVPVDRKEEVCNRKKPAPAVKERRGCYKRRRTIDSCEKVSVTIEDGFAWRKYGQKGILNSTSPRCYFRCTHKTLYGCKALKQVQKLEDGSNKYHITYIGKHTCPTFSNQAVVLNFEDFKNHHHVPTSPSTITNIHIDPFVKQEVDSKEQSTNASEIVSSTNDENSSPVLGWDDVFMGHQDASFMGFEYVHEDSCASTSSHGYLDHIGFLNNDEFLSGSLLDVDDVFV